MIWISFTFSLEATYRTEKTNDISSIASYILTKWSEEGFTTDSLDRIAHDNDTCVLIQDRYGLSVYSYDVMGKNCLLPSCNCKIYGEIMDMLVRKWRSIQHGSK